MPGENSQSALGAKSKKSKKKAATAKDNAQTTESVPRGDSENAETAKVYSSSSPLLTINRIPNDYAQTDPNEIGNDENPSADAPQPDTTETTDENAQNDSSNGSKTVIGAHKDSDDAPATDAEPNDRFDALVRDRDSLRAEVIDMRKSLEEIQSKHKDDMEALQQKLGDSETKKEQAEAQFQMLLERVNTIKSQLGQRLKEDEEELSQARSQIEDLEDENANLKSQLDSKSSELTEVSDESKQKSKEINTLRDRTTLSQQNWLKEKDGLIEQEAYLQSEFEQAKEAMHNWEILAMEERSIRENLGEKVVDLEEQLGSLRDAYEKVSGERDGQQSTVDGLQRALQEIQAARKQELRELVESSDTQLEELRRSLREAQQQASDADKNLHTAQEEIERVRPFEKEVKEKNLLIGKLRHEAVTLNDHLTKALRFLKKGKAEDNVDRNIVTNHFLHFLALDRSDPKKFQILQLIAALLGWDDGKLLHCMHYGTEIQYLQFLEQREQAGLARPGTSNQPGKLRVPGTPLRTPSTPNLAGFMDNGGSATKEGLAELWSDFLDREAEEKQMNSMRRGSHPGPAKS
ncbi:uncharacterized protein N7483_011463 [Penicillium malachiteum]|uniref:uncharacterized protein n=1 Tax=Penicillium malachiteum TaxID=1324776 RepID=UPI0025489BF2|nr:uncharacterized protein N7483_011463 [Penicillium malachiteum]KAJ5714282.1 hypothetical protein N7483_011463 [Penicillium malachiteum]